MSLTWTVFEILGTVAFAFSGAAVGLARGMDVFGIALLSVVTAVGGGILRDVLAGIFPPFARGGPDAIVLALVTAAAVCIGFRHFHIPRRGRKLVLFAYRISDTAGLAAFTVTGAMTAIDSYPGYRYVLPVLLGLITAVGGGILRDVLAQKVGSAGGVGHGGGWRKKKGIGRSVRSGGAAPAFKAAAPKAAGADRNGGMLQPLSSLSSALDSAVGWPDSTSVSPARSTVDSS